VSPDRPEDSILRPPKPSPKLSSTENGEEVEIISEYSWRNFFSSINFLKVLQKLTKHRSHRTYMLNQYKSSVSIFWSSE
jgi:pterin-4a-carbinolamine dehydratase